MIRTAAAQVVPRFLDLEKTIDRACERIAEAGGAGARLVLFPESYGPGYPDRIWVVPAGRGAMLADLHAALLANSVTIPGDAARRLCDRSPRRILDGD